MGAKRAGIVVATIALALPAAAHASTYCVHQTGSCPAGQVDEGGNLQKALDDATGSGNIVTIGAGTYTHDNGFQYAGGTNAVTITGAGSGQTILASTAAHPAAGYVMALSNSAQSLLSGVTIHVANGDGGGLAIGGATADGIAVTVDPGGAGNQNAAGLGGGATIQHSTLLGDLTAGCCAAAVWNNGGSAGTLIDDTLQGYIGISATGAGSSIVAKDVRVTAHWAVDVINSAAATVDGMLALVDNPDGYAAIEANTGADLTVRSATLVHTGSPAGIGVRSESSGGHTSLNFTNSIARGFATSYERTAGPAATADLNVNSDDIAAGSAGSGTGTFSNAGDIDADPLFVDGYHLGFGSPAIDAGGACNATCQAVPDLDGLLRPVDGNGDGTPVRDLGAYEYGRRAPTVTAAAGSPTAGVGDAVTFTATGTDPDPGDAVALTWSFDDGATATGASVAHAFTTPGSHTATVTATDPAGLTATAAANVSVSAPPTSTVTLPTPLPTADRTPPVVGALHLSHRTFRRGTHAAKVATVVGTTISFSLSEDATVRITFAKRSTKTHRYATVHARSATITVKAGKPSIRFEGILDGRHELSKGSYELALTATDRAGNRAAARHATFAIV